MFNVIEYGSLLAWSGCCFLCCLCDQSKFKFKVVMYGTE